MANYAFTTGKSLPMVENGHEFKECNFCQLEPNTTIFSGVTGLKFIRCNLTNCTIPIDAVKESCIHRQISFCTNLNPDLTDYGLTGCATECVHMVNKDEVWVDGVLVDTIYEYEDSAV